LDLENEFHLSPEEARRALLRWSLILSEVNQFTELNGFINVFLADPFSPLADRVQVSIKKKQIRP